MKNITSIAAISGLLIACGGIIYAAGVQNGKITQNQRDIDRNEKMITATIPSQIAQLRQHIDGQFTETNRRIDGLMRHGDR